jgi:hypothetical protein
MTIERKHIDADRYAFDFNTCTSELGWAQVDTTQDAWYYGTWANPITLEVVNYCEGDVTHSKNATKQEFIAEIHALHKWNSDNGYWKGIDGMCNERIINAFTALGLAHLLH